MAWEQSCYPIYHNPLAAATKSIKQIWVSFSQDYRVKSLKPLNNTLILIIDQVIANYTITGNISTKQKT